MILFYYCFGAFPIWQDSSKELLLPPRMIIVSNAAVRSLLRFLIWESMLNSYTIITSRASGIYIVEDQSVRRLLYLSLSQHTCYH